MTQLIKNKNNRMNPLAFLPKKNSMMLSLMYCMLLGFVSHIQAQDFDLALKVYPTVHSSVQANDVVEFTIEVYNQGDIDATNVKLVNYVPSGLEFVAGLNPDWNISGSKAVRTLTEVIASNSSLSTTINLKVKQHAVPQNVKNYTEILLAQDTNGNDMSDQDVDSTPDAIVDNDAGAQAYTYTDDYIADTTAVFDEDDHDVAQLILCGQTVCNSSVNISLNASCITEINADMIIENPQYGNDAYIVTVEDENGNIVPQNMINGTHVGQKLKVHVSLPQCPSDQCWGYANIEDKTALMLHCAVDTVDCGFEDPESIGLPIADSLNYAAQGDDFVVFGLNGCGDVTLSYTDEIEMMPCKLGSPFISKITREWYVVDELGNFNACTSEIYLRKGTLNKVQAPKDYINNPLECNSFIPLPNGAPKPETTGEPTNTACSNIIVAYEDLIIPSNVCESQFDVRREWTVVDWCTGKDTTMVQMIKIMDNQAPVCSDPGLFYGQNYEDKCTGMVQVKSPVISDHCSAYSYTIQYKPFKTNNKNYNNLSTLGIDGTSGNYTISGLKVGKYRIAYFVEDACGNKSQCMGVFEIRDLQDPTPICIIETEVVLDAYGKATLPASAFDAGSFDNCGVDSIKVRKMNADCGPNTDKFADEVHFCCADAAGETMVVFRVIDLAGNVNDCMVRVHVRDEIIPTIQCPADLTMSCSEYDACDGDIPTSVTGFPIGSDNCDLKVEYFDSKAFNNCGVGIVVRNWSVIDQAGNKATCKQYIEINSDVNLSVDIVDWPNDTTLYQCISDPITKDQVGWPTIDNHACNSFTITYVDIKNNSNNGCGIVERTYTVKDHCALDINNNTFSYIQRITIKDIVDPEIMNCVDITVEADNATCEAQVQHTILLQDNCTAQADMSVVYTIDLHNDKIKDNIVKHNREINRTMPIGKHRVDVIAQDACQNETTCTFYIHVKETKNPTPICKPISLSLGTNGNVEIWASDFNHKSFDNCTKENQLVFSFSEDINDQIKTFDCSVINNGITGIVNLKLYAWDQSGNYDYCNTHVTITDAASICPGSSSVTANLEGKMMTIKGQEDFEGVQLNLLGDNNMQKQQLSDADGHYSFNNLPVQQKYQLTPVYNKDALNGVSTLDIVQIQKHILGIAPFEYVHQFIAADVNNSKSINGSDLVQLRKLILGRYNNDILPNNTSWRFIPTDFQWNFYEPHNVPEHITVQNLTQSMNELMFYGIKVGDINNSHQMKLQDESATRNGAVDLVLADVSFNKEELQLVPVRISESMRLEGMQLELSIDVNRFEVLELLSGSCQLDADNYVLESNTVKLSWLQIGGVDVQAETDLFYIKVRSLGAKQITERDVVLSHGFKQEVYNQHEDIFDLKLRVSSENETTERQLLCYPNPFSEETSLKFTTLTTGQVSVQLVATDGTLIWNSERLLPAGEHDLLLDKSIFKSVGVYYLHLKTPEGTQVQKLIRIE